MHVCESFVHSRDREKYILTNFNLTYLVKIPVYKRYILRIIKDNLKN